MVGYERFNGQQELLKGEAQDEPFNRYKYPSRTPYSTKLDWEHFDLNVPILTQF